MDLGRLGRYLRGGRDAAVPRESRGVVLPGVVYFATESAVWGGGRGFYDPVADGRVLARAHLMTAGQFSDIAAQEMSREPGSEIDLGEVALRGRVELGPGRYETVVRVGEVEDVPMVTFTAPWGVGGVELREPAAAYLRHLALGLRAAGEWSDVEIAGYLAGCPGAAGRWSVDGVLALMGVMGVMGVMGGDGGDGG